MADRPDGTMDPGTYLRTTYVAAQATTTTNTVPVFVNDYGCSVQVTRASYIPRSVPGALAGANYKKMSLVNRGTAGTSNVHFLSSATMKLSAVGSVTAFNATAWTLSTTAASVTVDDGEVVVMAVANQVGGTSGNNLPEGIVSIEFQYV